MEIGIGRNEMVLEAIKENPIVGFDREGGVMVSGFENGGWCFLEEDAPL